MGACTYARENDLERLKYLDMKIEQNRIDDLNLELTLSVGKEDYAESRKKRLNDFRKKAEIKGFRKGMVPMSLVEKMYGQQALADAVNDVISESLNNFIAENNLKSFDVLALRKIELIIRIAVTEISYLPVLAEIEVTVICFFEGNRAVNINSS